MTDPVRAERLALVGAASHVGTEIKGQLARAGVPGSHVDLLDLSDHVGLLTDYGEEARVVLEAARDSVAGYRLACFCGDPEVARRFIPVVVEAGGVAVDCTGGLAGDEPARLAGTTGDGSPGLVVVPHPATLLLSALGRAVTIDGAAVTLLLPASELADGSAEAMARQATNLLNFGETGDAGEPPFGRRMAFDVWIQGGATRARILRELGALGHAPPRLAALRAPVFHALAASVFLPGQEPEALGASLRGAGLMGARPAGDEPEVDSPARVVGRGGVHVTGLSGDRDGSWLWAVADNHQAIAETALEVLLAHLEPGLVAAG